MRVFAIVILSAVAVACGQAAMSGSSQTKAPKPSVTAEPSPAPVATGVDLGTTGASPAPGATSGPLAVPENVDGQEILRDVASCVARAKELSARTGFVADISRTVNEGFYKIEPSQGLCDIHFVQNIGDPIQDHEGHDSVLDHQVALYCPCNGGWAVDDTW
jgi:hypothetical protein